MNFNPSPRHTALALALAAGLIAAPAARAGLIAFAPPPPGSSETRVADRAPLDLVGKRRVARRAVTRMATPLPEVVATLQPGVSPELFAASYGLPLRSVSRVDGRTVILGANSVEGARRLAETLRRDRLVVAAWPNRTSLKKRLQFVSNDPFFPGSQTLAGQWNLSSPNNQYTDIRALGAWNRGDTGAGVTVGYIDDGFQITHPDLAPSYSAADSYDFGTNDTDPSPVFDDDYHGTNVAGVGSARGGNGIGVTGAAPLSTWAGLRIDFTNLTAQQFVDATLYRSSGANLQIKVKNHSYGPVGAFLPDDGELGALATSTAAGAIHVYAAGDDRGTENGDANKNALAASPDAIAVAATGPDGKFAGLYSAFGANVFVAAPSDSDSGPGILTTDLLGETLGLNGVSDGFSNSDYTGIAGGTSMAAPHISAAAAAVAAIRPTANTRYLKHLLVRTARKVDLTDASASSDGGWKTNAAGFSTNQNYGFGLLDLDALTVAARRFSGVTAAGSIATGTVAVNASIPDATSPAAPGILTRTFTLSGTTPLEEVLVKIIATHAYRGDLSATLTSPSGTVSRLFQASSSDSSGEGIDWTFTANAFWGENPAGTWTLRMLDTDILDQGSLTSFAVTARTGSLVAAPAVFDGAFVSQSVPTTLSTQASATATVTMRNTGTTDWSDLALIRLSSTNPDDNTTWGRNRVIIPTGVSVRPGDAYSFTFPITAPAAVGTANFQWRMIREGVGRFGAPSTNFPVTIVGGALAAEYVSQNVPPTATLGGPVTFTFTMRNVGTETWTANLFRLSTVNPIDNVTFGTTRALLPAGTTVAPGATGVFTLQGTAPTSPGNFTFQGQMVKEGVVRFGQSTPIATVTVAGVALSAQYVSQTVPTTVAAGGRLIGSIVMRNTGTETWTPNGVYKLCTINPQDSTVWGTSRIVLTSGSVAPGANATFGFNLDAPNVSGSYNFQWRMVKEGVVRFGDNTPNVVVAASVPVLDASFISQSGVPTSMTRGATTTVTIVMRNTGSETWTANSLYRLASESPEDNRNWGRNRIILTSGSVAPGADGTFTFTITAPATAGTYGFQWRMVKEGVLKFGTRSTLINIAVN